MSYGGGHRLDGMEPVSEGHDASRDILNRAVPTLQQFHEEREVAMRNQEVERNALDFTVARFRLLAERWAHQSERAREEAYALARRQYTPGEEAAVAEVARRNEIDPYPHIGRMVIYDEIQDERFATSERTQYLMDITRASPPPERQEEEEEEEEAAAEPSPTVAAGSNHGNRTRDLEMIASHANVVGLNLPSDLVALAYDRNNGDLVDTLTNLTEPIFRRELERELSERQEEEARARLRAPLTPAELARFRMVMEQEQQEMEEEEEEQERFEQVAQHFAIRDDVDIVRAQDSLRQAAEALARSQARAQRSIGAMRDSHQEARAALGSFQGAVAELVALRRAQVTATEVVATQPSPVQHVQFLPNTGKSVRVRELARASLTKEREDLEEQMERMEITEGVYLERMNALRDRYNRASYGLALSADASTRAGNNLPFEMRRPRAFETDSSWAHEVHPAPLDDEPPNNEIEEVD